MPLTPHPEYESFCRRLQGLPKGSSEQFEGTLFRFVHPRYSSKIDATSGVGALKTSGRWHPQGMFACLYTSTTPETALQEMLAANRYNRLPDHRSLPSTLLGIHAKLYHLLDLTSGKLRQRLRLSHSAIQNCNWRDTNRFDRTEALTQALGRAAFELGYEGIIAPSTANRPNGRNVVIFPGKLLRSKSITLLTPIPNT